MLKNTLTPQRQKVKVKSQKAIGKGQFHAKELKGKEAKRRAKIKNVKKRLNSLTAKGKRQKAKGNKQ